MCGVGEGFCISKSLCCGSVYKRGSFSDKVDHQAFCTHLQHTHTHTHTHTHAHTHTYTHTHTHTHTHTLQGSAKRWPNLRINVKDLKQETAYDNSYVESTEVHINFNALTSNNMKVAELAKNHYSKHI